MSGDAGRWAGWGVQAPAAGVVAAVGLLEVGRREGSAGREWGAAALVVIGFAIAVALSRRSPAAALGVVWLAALLQLQTGTAVLLVEATVAVVAYGCARWGQPTTLVLSGISIPAAGLLGVYLVANGSYGFFRGIGVLRTLMDGAYRFSDTLLVGATILGLLLLAVPWLAGLTVRGLVRARRSEVGQIEAEEQAAQAQVETGQAQEIAQLREEQARLARDVHDVVGHSLAVILAQAESAQYLPDDPASLKRTMATIAGSARSSLQDVRQVLAGPGHPAAPARTGAFEQLLDGVRAGGHEVTATEVGTPQPLPPELEVVAHRVVQEMLTNAIRHGRRESPVHVERHWPEGGLERDLRIEVRNVWDQPAPLDETQPIGAVATPAPPSEPPGRGLDGMRRRLDSVGGRLDVRRRIEPDGPTFTATAWVPVSGR